MSAFLAGFLAPWQGLAALARPGLRRYVAVPLAINVALFSLALYWLMARLADLVDGLFPWWLAWLEWLLWPLVALLAMFLVLFSFARVCNVVAAPFTARLCRVLLRAQPHTPLARACARGRGRGAFASVGHEALKLGLFLLWFVPLSLLSLVPFLGLPAALTLVVVSVYWNALEYIDYPLSEAGVPLRGLRRHIRRRPALMLGFGVAQTLLVLCPVLNLASAPAGAAGATRLCLARLQQEELL